MPSNQVVPDTSSARNVEVIVAPRPQRARRLLLLLWAATVFTPWLLQIRSFVDLVGRHRISEDLVPPRGAAKRMNNLTEQCLVQGLYLGGMWWHMNPTHYFTGDHDTGDGVLCHFRVAFFNIHGAYRIQRHTAPSAPIAPLRCANDSYAFKFFLHHGSIGYYAFYADGFGSFCSLDSTAYGTSSSIGTSDINFSVLANFNGTSDYQGSFFFGCFGAVWLLYRALIVARSFVCCSLYGCRLDKLHEPISLACAMVFIQQASRIVPHTAKNWHRLMFVYFLVESLMADLFMIVVCEGVVSTAQYISLGYNVAGFLSVLFELVENTKLLLHKKLLITKRLFFNSESALCGELLFALVMADHLTALDSSALHQPIQVVEAASDYGWSLFGHTLIVLRQSAIILLVRAVVSIGFVLWQFRSIAMLAAPCCVDQVMGYRYKLAKLNGYVYDNKRLSLDQDTLKAHGLLMGIDRDGKEVLVYHKIRWFPATRGDLSILGTVIREHVELCEESTYSGPVAVCNHVLGGTRSERELDAEPEELEGLRWADHVSEFPV